MRHISGYWVEIDLSRLTWLVGKREYWDEWYSDSFPTQLDGCRWIIFEQTFPADEQYFVRQCIDDLSRLRPLVAYVLENGSWGFEMLAEIWIRCGDCRWFDVCKRWNWVDVVVNNLAGCWIKQWKRCVQHKTCRRPSIVVMQLGETWFNLTRSHCWPWKWGCNDCSRIEL